MGSLRGELHYEDLLKVAQAVESHRLTDKCTALIKPGKNNSGNGVGRYQGRKKLLAIAMSCFEELTSPRFVSKSLIGKELPLDKEMQEQDINMIEPYLMHSFLLVNYMYLNLMNELHYSKSTGVGVNAITEDTKLMLVDGILGKLRQCTHLIHSSATTSNRSPRSVTTSLTSSTHNATHHGESKNNTSFNNNNNNNNISNISNEEMEKSIQSIMPATLLFLCHELSFRFKTSLRPKPDVEGALASIQMMQKLRKAHTSKGENNLRTNLIAQQKEYPGIHENVVNKAKDNKMSKDIKRLGTYIAQTRKETLLLNRTIRETFDGLWSRRTSVVEYAMDILERDARSIDPSKQWLHVLV